MLCSWVCVCQYACICTLQELEVLQQGMRRLQERVCEQDSSLQLHERRVLEVVQVRNMSVWGQACVLAEG